MKAILTELLIPCVSLFALVACTTRKEWTPTGASRADGMVALSYEYGLFENPQENQDQGLNLAASSCEVWGYTGANPFGESKRCEATDQYGTCVRWEVTQRYQCTGAPSTSNAQAPIPSTPSVAPKPNAEATASGQVHQI